MASSVVLLVLVMLAGVPTREASASRLIFQFGGSPLTWTLRAKLIPAPPNDPTLLDVAGRIRCHGHRTHLCPLHRGVAQGIFGLTTTLDGTGKDASLTMYVHHHGARCVFDGRVATGLGVYSCRDRKGNVVAEEIFTFDACGCRGRRVCRSMSPCLQ